ncbi:hypothetical protein BA895_14550 [Humibacillus sp. DSM 29435]|uniref:uridine kinase family protein n=1 Tax=Humibacillus sp. DSM 29435 TaxID=1869167 RepID=UPI0008730637|nr:hypothetical protein [Humibacillus sp. DSM 29435]OFE17709.1 hypothetical protein BA895_14550 [Humibacillus sp. DSM 29435]
MWDDITASPEPEHVAAITALAAGADPRCGATVVVAIDGPSGAGKTTLAQGVADALAALPGILDLGVSTRVELVHMDHLYPGWDGLAAAPGLLTAQVLEPISRGEPAAYRLWSWLREEWRGSRAVLPSRFLVVEGCGASVMPAGAYAAVRVFVEADPGLRMERGIARDGEAYRPKWQQWADQETALFESDGTRRRADLLVDTSSV